MTLVKYSPFNELVSAQNRIVRLLDSFMNDTPQASAPTLWAPEVDIEETNHAIVLRADLPGLNRNDIHVYVDADDLVLQGERFRQEESKDRTLHRVERIYGSFRRSFKLPAIVLRDKVEATYRDGVLEVMLPKAEEVQPKSIDIK